VETQITKKGHTKWVLEQNFVDANVVHEDETFDDPSILQHILHLNHLPSIDPLHQRQSMVFQMG
jgi:hypothetical protein